MQTEASVYHPHFGCIPSSWMVVDAIEACSKITDGTHDTPKAVPDGQPYIKSVHIKNGEVDFDNCLFVSEADHETIFRRCNPEKGDLLVVNIGAGNIGDCAYVTVDFEFRMKNIALLKPKKDTLNSLYFYYYYRSRQERITHTAKTGGAQPFLSLKDLKKLKVVLPPINEQCKIARILLTWDKAISTIERLIDNSKQQKKALMQQLLTGKKRLLDDSDNPFDGKWEALYLHDVAKIIVSPVDKKAVEGEIPVTLCNYTDVYYNTRISKSLDFMKATAKQSEIDKYTLQVNDVIITKDSETPGDIAVPALVDEDLGGVVCGYHLAIIRPKARMVAGAYLNYLFSMPKTRYYFFTLATGATRFGLSVGGINKAHFTLPPLDEQQKIAAVLTNADKEIELLQQQLDDLKQEKKALMQQLLTGKRRVKVDEKEVA
ncbi:MAG TPA: hypothetical protein DCW49_07675 [Alteromonas australica]|nr:hypothetical protein [Alteromonas australica]